MLFYKFKNYEEFKSIFGIIEHGNGVKSRKNKILLALYKDRRFLKELISHYEYEEVSDMRTRYSYGEDRRRSMRYANCTRNYDWWHTAYVILSDRYYKMPDEKLPEQPLSCTSLIELKSMLYRFLNNYELFIHKDVHEMYIGNRRFYSNLFTTDQFAGLCEDKTTNAIRYVNVEKNRTFKMKAGKMFNHIMSCNKVLSSMPEQIQRWLSEEFVGEWIEYARKNLIDTGNELHVDDNFMEIYSSDYCAGYDEDSDCFGSCMVDDDQHTFYENAVDAKAAYLTDTDGMIVARCIIYTNVHEQGSDRIWRLAERQYSKSCDLSLQRQLICALINEGHIDGFKKVGASCHAPREFVDCEGNSLESKNFWIPCHLEDGDTLSYQDSFKWYNPDSQRAYNYEKDGADVDLSTTDDTVRIDNHEDECWSDYHDCYIPDYNAIYIDSRGDYFYDNECHRARVLRSDGTFYEEWCYEDDCIEIGDSYYYAGHNCDCPEEYGILRCPECDEWLISDREESAYSDLTEMWYCCESCLEDAEKRYHEENGDAFSTYDGVWFTEGEILSVWEWNGWMQKFYKTTISIESFNNLVEDGYATIFCGEYFIDRVMLDGEPVHEEYLNRVA